MEGGGNGAHVGGIEGGWHTERGNESVRRVRGRRKGRMELDRQLGRGVDRGVVGCWGEGEGGGVSEPQRDGSRC